MQMFRCPTFQISRNEVKFPFNVAAYAFVNIDGVRSLLTYALMTRHHPTTTTWTRSWLQVTQDEVEDPEDLNSLHELPCIQAQFPSALHRGWIRPNTALLDVTAAYIREREREQEQQPTSPWQWVLPLEVLDPVSGASVAPIDTHVVRLFQEMPALCQVQSARTHRIVTMALPQLVYVPVASMCARGECLRNENAPESEGEWDVFLSPPSFPGEVPVPCRRHALFVTPDAWNTHVHFVAGTPPRYKVTNRRLLVPL